jgi:hypothetical protein
MIDTGVSSTEVVGTTVVVSEVVGTTVVVSSFFSVVVFASLPQEASKPIAANPNNIPILFMLKSPFSIALLLYTIYNKYSVIFVTQGGFL